MGIGSFLAAQADRNQYLYYMRTTEERVKRSCMGEMEREVHEVLEDSGVDKKVASLVALSLYIAEKEAGDQTTIKLPFYSLRSLTARIGGRVGLTPLYVISMLVILLVLMKLLVSFILEKEWKKQQSFECSSLA